MTNDNSSEEAHLLEPGDELTLHGPDADDADDARLVAEVNGASDGKFMIDLTDVPSWLKPGATISGETRTPVGARYFTAKIAWVLPSDDLTQILFHQPKTAIDVDERLSTRVPMDIEATWSRLDSDMHPGNDHHGRVHNLSATGMRLDTSQEVGADDRIVASLPLTSGVVNVIGTVLAVEGAGVEAQASQMRVVFSRLDDATWCTLVAEIAELAAMTGEVAMTPNIVHSSLNRRAIVAYASSDQRR